VGDGTSETEGLVGGPSAVGRDEAVRTIVDGGRDDERVGKAKASVPRSELGSPCGDVEVERHDGDRHVCDEIVHSDNGAGAGARGTDEGLGERRGSHGQVIAITERVSDHPSGAVVVRVMRVQESDQHTRIEVDQRHSLRSSSSSSVS